MSTLLARKSGLRDMAIAPNDEVKNQLINDPAVPQFVSGDLNNTFETPPYNQSSMSGFSQQTTFTSYNSQANPSTNTQPILTTAGTNAAQNAEVLVKLDKGSEDWVNRKWRPAMGWMYMTVCITDFIIFPVLWSILQAVSKGQVTSQWQPLTLQGAGLFHVAMGTVLGIAAYGRTKEKIENNLR